MFIKLLVLYCALVVIDDTKAFVRRDTLSSSPNPNVLESFQRNLEMFKNCIDQTLAKAVGEVNEKQLQPIFGVIGDSMNRVSKAFDDLTASSKNQQFHFK